MDKKKVIELISDAIYQLDPFGMDMDNYDNLCKNATKILYLAKEELQKSDWISVEDELPKYCEQVLVIPNNIRAVPYITCRVRSNRDYELDKNNFIKLPPFMGLDITHWRKIEKLEV